MKSCKLKFNPFDINRVNEARARKNRRVFDKCDYLDWLQRYCKTAEICGKKGIRRKPVSRIYSNGYEKVSFINSSFFLYTLNGKIRQAITK